MATPNNDIFTIKQSLGFWSVNDADQRVINGETSAGNLSISSYTDNSTGSNITLYGKTSANSTELHFSSSLTGGGLLATFDNYNPTLHNNLQIGNNAQIVIGPIELYGPSNSSAPGQVNVISYGTTGDGIDFRSCTGPSTWVSYMRIYNTGAVAIGNDPTMTTPNGPGAGNLYSLYVQYGILTEQVRVAINGSLEWADYVFAKDYKLMPLNKVEAYVKDNNHLPGVPSAEEVKKNGIDLGSMDSKLLQKIEELTLYVIAQQKEIDELKDEVKNKK